MLLRASVSKRTSVLLDRYAQTMGELTLREQTEKALRAAKVESDLASRAKSSFLGTVSHELRTPLNAIIGFSELIESSAANGRTETSAEYAAQIQKAGRHMLSIISDILDMSKIESGSLQLDLDEHDIAELIEDTVGMVRQSISEKNQTVEVRLPKTSLCLPLDARRIKQVLLNLVTNAHKYTQEGGNILITARRNRDGGITVAVVDNGIGMTADEMAIAIEPFGQIQSIYTRAHEGSGLGLAIARGIARQHGGDLYLESEPQIGTTVVLTLRAAIPVLGYAYPASAGGGERSKPRRTTIAKGKPKS